MSIVDIIETSSGEPTVRINGARVGRVMEMTLCIEPIGFTRMDLTFHCTAVNTDETKLRLEYAKEYVDNLSPEVFHLLVAEILRTYQLKECGNLECGECILGDVCGTLVVLKDDLK